MGAEVILLHDTYKQLSLGAHQGCSNQEPFASFWELIEESFHVIQPNFGKIRARTNPDLATFVIF